MSIWDSKIEDAEEFRRSWCEHAKRVYERYEDERKSEQAMTQNIKKANFFYSNVNTLKESLYNSPPKPDVSRMHKGSYDDDVSRVAALIVARGLEYEVECAPNFEEAIESAILDRLVPGLGAVWVSFGEGEVIKVEHVYWEDFLYGPARKWSKVPWVGRRHHFTKEEFVERFGEPAMRLVQEANEKGRDTTLSPQVLTKDKICVYEIWDKKTKKVYFISKGLEKPLKEEEDPYGLQKFFPCPRPLIANVTTTKFLPVTDYHIAQDQYLQLDVLYARISLITDAIKVAGLYNGANKDISRMFQNGENILIPCDKWAMLAAQGGIQGQIDWYPVEKVASVLAALQAQFEAAKATLYEVTGMSDIIRGASNPYETKGAQEIKAQFASVRLNGYQRDVAKFVTGTMRIIAEMMCQLYSPEKLQQIVGQLPQPDAELAPQALEILKDDFQMKYKVNIQANSLTQADWALEKEQRMEVVQNLGQMIQNVVGVAESEPRLLTLMVQMIKFAISGFKGATELEGWIDSQLDQLLQEEVQRQQNPEPEEPSPEEQKMQMEMQMRQQEMGMKMQADQQSSQIKMAEMQAKMEMEQQKMAMEVQKMEMEIRHKQQMNAMDIQMKQLELELKAVTAEMEMRNKRETADMEMETAALNSAMDLENKEAQNQQKAKFAEEDAKRKAKQKGDK